MTLMRILFLKPYNFLLDNKYIFVNVITSFLKEKKNLNDNKANVISKLHDIDRIHYCI